MSSLQSLIYISAAKFIFEDDDHEELIKIAQHNNKKHAVTGLLVTDGKLFVQAIEGSPKTIETLYRNIKNDKRHHGIQLIYNEPASKRVFSDWHMGFRDLRKIKDVYPAELSRTDALERALNLPRTQTSSIILSATAFSLDFGAHDIVSSGTLH